MTVSPVGRTHLLVAGLLAILLSSPTSARVGDGCLHLRWLGQGDGEPDPPSGGQNVVVPLPRADNARVLVRMALEIREYVAQHEFGGQRLTLRIGINSGPIVAGVIGRRKFIYDLWGDAVNVASRMESTGREGAIQVTRGTYERIKDQFVCQAMGTVNVKGKGAIEVWHVIAEQAGAATL